MIQILVTLFILVNSCKRCISDKVVYDCGVGSIIKFGTQNKIGVCCDSIWNECYQSSGLHCIGYCPIGHKVNNNTPQMLNNFVTNNDRLYSEYVTVIKIQNGQLNNAKMIHSLDLSIGDLVIWPGKEFHWPRNDVIVKVMRNDIDHLNPICCTNTSNPYKFEIYCGKYCNHCPNSFSSSGIICDGKVHSICCDSSLGRQNNRAICICEKNPICECF